VLLINASVYQQLTAYKIIGSYILKIFTQFVVYLLLVVGLQWHCIFCAKVGKLGLVLVAGVQCSSL